MAENVDWKHWEREKALGCYFIKYELILMQAYKEKVRNERKGNTVLCTGGQANLVRTFVY